MKGVVLQALKGTFVGDTAKLAETHTILSELARSAGFCMTLMEITVDESLNLPLKQAALIQLKNNIRARWKTKTIELAINKEEKEQIRNVLVEAMIRCGKEYQLIKLYKEIITIVVSMDYQEWLPLQQIHANFAKKENIPASLQCLIAIATTFQFTVKPDEKHFFNQVLKVMLPQVINLIKENNNNPEILFLSIKFFWKSIHSEISKEIKFLTLDWMELFHNVLTAFNDQFQKKVNDIHPKKTLQFYYFHSKKWTTRIVLRYLQKHAKQNTFMKQLPDNKEFSELWHSKYGPVFLKVIIEQISIPTIKKARFFQLKCLQNWVSEKPQLIQEYAHIFQYQILPQFIKLKQEDDTLAKNDPIEYLTKEEEPLMSYTNLKKAATELWTSFTQMGSKTDHKLNIFTPGPLFNDNLNYLLKNLANSNLLQKELAMYLLCQIRYTIIRVPEAKKLIPDIFNNYIVQELQSSQMLMRMRANDVFTRYGREQEIMDIGLITKAAEGIYMCLSMDQSPLVRIKAASAFHNLIKHPNAKELVKPKLKQILQIYLKLIEQYDLEQLIYGLERIVENFGNEIGPFAIEMFKILSQLFIKLFNKDIEQNANNSEYEGETEIAAAGVLKAMAQIIESPIDQKIRQEIEPDVLEIVYFVFSGESVEYSQQILDLLNTHLYRIDVLSPNLWSFYQTTVYFLVGIPEDYWKQIEQTNMPEKLKILLKNIKDSENLEYFEHALLVLRNFMNKGSKMIVTQNAMFKQNFVHVIFYLISSVYKNYAKNSYEGQIDLDCCTVLMIYLVETFPLQMVGDLLPVIWSYCRFNCLKAKTIYLRSLTVQLIGILFWKFRILFLKQITPDSLELVLNTFTKYYRLLEERHERKRGILGAASILLLEEKPQPLLNSTTKIFKMLIKLVRRNAQSRLLLFKFANRNTQLIEDEQNDIEQKNESEEEDLNVEEEDEEDDGQFWDEQFSNNYTSPIKNIDELNFFKQCMMSLQANQNTFYNALIELVPQQKLSQLESNLQKAMSISESGNAC